MGNLCPHTSSPEEEAAGELSVDTTPSKGGAGEEVFIEDEEAPEEALAEDGEEEAKSPSKEDAGRAGQARWITRQMLGPPPDDFADALPSWSWEVGAGKWKNYSLEESLLLDRYWQVFVESKERGPLLCNARVKLKTEVSINFARMTSRAKGARPRKIRRATTDPGWLSNAYFFKAFTEALNDAGIEVKNTPEEMFEFCHNQDFRGMADDGRKLHRGGQPYELPVGWKRFAVNVKGQYDDGNNRWLKEDDSGWAVAYHGTAPEGLPGILCTGFRVGDRQKFEGSTGKGVYCTQWIDVAQHYSKPRTLGDHDVQIVLQLRVKPSAIRKITDGKATAFEKKYWVINSPGDIRAYGVLLREWPLSQWVPPEIMVYGADHPGAKKVMAALRDEVAAKSGG